jgi:Concanavalin A-like lectin/glucanases superfamily
VRSLFTSKISFLVAFGALWVACITDDATRVRDSSSNAADGADGSGVNGADASSTTSLCSAVVGYWPGEKSPEDLARNSPLTWQPPSAQPSYVPGKVGWAFDLAAGPGYLENRNFNSLANTSEFSLAFWFAMRGAAPRDFLSTSIGNQTLIRLRSENRAFKLELLNETVDSQEVTLDAVAPTHVAVVVKTAATGSSVLFFINGTPGPAATLTRTLKVGDLAGNAVLHIGESSLISILDEVTLFDRAISAAEIEDLRSNGLQCPGPLTRSDAGVPQRCAAPTAPPPIMCAGAVCAPGELCCGATNEQCKKEVDCTSTNKIACTKSADCGNGLGACCTTSFTMGGRPKLECTTLSATLTSSMCVPGPTGCPDSVRLCASTADCSGGEICTGFIAMQRGSNADYRLGACLGSIAGE